MATKEEIRDIVVFPLTANYGQPKDEPDAFRELLVKTLDSFSADALDKAVTKLVMTRRYKTWPTIAEIVEAARSINGEKGKVRYPSALSGVNKDNFWTQSQAFVDRDFDARGTCLEYVRQGSRSWEAWAVYFIEFLGFRPTVLNKIGWYAPTQWPGQFDRDVGLKADSAVMHFEEYEPETSTSYEDREVTDEEKKNVVELWGKLKVDLLKSARSQAIL